MQPAYLILALGLLELPHIVNPVEFCIHSASQTLYTNRAARNSRPIAHISAHMHAPVFHQISLMKHKFKHKVVKNFKVMTAEY